MFEGRIFKCCYHTLLISPLLSGLRRDILRFTFFICRHRKPFFSRLLFAVRVYYCLILSFCWLQGCPYDKYWIITLLIRHSRGEHKVVFVASTPHVELLHFSVLDKLLWVKCFSLCYSKHMAIPVYDVMFYNLRFNVLLPENYLFFREMVIRYLTM